MELRAFLSLVLPVEDNYVLFVARPGGRNYNQNCATIDETCAVVEKLDSTAATVYLAVGKYANNTEVQESGRVKTLRTKEHATKFKSLCVDVDVKAGSTYENQADAVAAVHAACQQCALPEPVYVDSGYGVHCWWPLTQSIPARTWEMLATALQGALQSGGVDLDTSKVKDLSMVLRPVGSHNKKDLKNWKEVRVLRNAAPTDALDIAKILHPYKAAVRPPSRPAGRTSAAMDALFTSADINLDDMKQCAQLDALLRSGGAKDAVGNDVVEPLWRASLGIAKYCEDQSDAVIRLASNYPDFDLEANLLKLSQYKGTGPTTCAYLEDLCPGGCNGCPHKGKITSPAQLTSGEETIVATVPTTAEDEAETVESIKIRGYSFKGEWLVYRAPGAEEDIPVANYHIIVDDAVSNIRRDKMTVRLLVKFPLEGWRRMEVPMTAISSGGKDLSNALSNRGVYIRGDLDRVRAYLMTYLSELQKQKNTTYQYQHLGWQDDTEFVTGDGIITASGVNPSADFEPAASELADVIQSRGDINLWSEYTRIFDHPDLPYRGLYFLMMAGGFLIKYTGIPSLMVNAYSADSGSGKSATGYFGCSIWGDPNRMAHSRDDTIAALYKGLGTAYSLTAYIDEVTTIDPRALRDMAYRIPEGRERKRLRSSAEGWRDVAEWRMPVFTSSNQDLQGTLGQRITSEAEQLRVLQIPFDRAELFTPADNIGHKLQKVIRDNHGLAGPMLVAEVFRQGGPVQFVDAARDEFITRYGSHFVGQERFYISAFIMAFCAAKLGAAIGDLFRFDTDKAISDGLQLIDELRQAAQTGIMDGLDILSQFLTEHGPNMVHLRIRRNQDNTGHGQITAPEHRAAVARTEIERDHTGAVIAGSYYINTVAFKQWCRDNGADYRTILRKLTQEGVFLREGVRKTLYKGVEGSGATGQTTCIEIDAMSNARLIEAQDLLLPKNLKTKPKLIAVK